MIQVSNLEKSYGQQVIFDKIGFSINAGERVGLVGRNGHGKTTLFRMILGEEHPDSGTISIPNNYSLGHLSQHISFTQDTVLKEGCLGLRAVDDGRDETYRVKSILMGLGFSEDDFQRHPSELSGGFQIRLNLTKLLVSEKNLLLLDEPTNYLDIVSIRWLTQFLRNWKDELILITHDRDFMDSVTTHTMAIHRCKVRKVEGPTWKVYDQLLMEEEVNEQTRINDEKKRNEAEQFINRFRAQATKAKAVQSRIKALQRKEKIEKITAIKNLDFEFNYTPFSGKLLMNAEEVSFSFGDLEADSQPLINKFSLAVGKDERIALIGKNGKGKTTLLNLLAGELQPLEGSIMHHPNLKLAYFGQTNINRLNPDQTVEQEMMDAIPDNNRRAARNICGTMMFSGDNALKKVSVLSGGEKSRVLLGKLLVAPANMLLLDEPTNHLDMESIDSLLEAIDAFKGAVIIVTHSEMILHGVATRLIVFDNDRISLFEGTYQDFLDRVGWANEDQPGNGKTKNTNGQNKGVNKKELRKMRAELINERSRAVGALQNRINEIEKTIMQLEQGIEKDTKALLKATEKGDWQASSELSKSVHSARGKIDKLFDELEPLTEKVVTKSKEFEERLSEI